MQARKYYPGYRQEGGSEGARAGKRELDQARLENVHLQAQMASMADELVQKSEEIRKYHVEQTVIFGRIRELVGHLSEIANKARLYD